MASSTTRAIVASAPGAAHEGGQNWTLQDLTLRALGDDEVLVQMVATGICHTDLLVSSIPAEFAGMMSVAYPKVVGHEGEFCLFVSALCVPMEGGWMCVCDLLLVD